MGTVVTIDVFPGNFADIELLRASIASAVTILHGADAVFSTWKPESPISRLRRGEIELDEAPPVVQEVLRRCETIRSLSGGWFDPWSIPGGVDPTGLVKGWAAQLTLDALHHDGVDGAIVNAAGDVATFGGPVAATRFRIGIVNPAKPLTVACIVESPGAVASSGDYERGRHLYDPYANAFTTRAASATVVGSNLGIADALATALVVGGKEVLDIIASLPDFEGLIIDESGAFHKTREFPLVS
jgi:thiamine biosynthesis lipoprotein